MWRSTALEPLLGWIASGVSLFWAALFFHCIMPTGSFFDHAAANTAEWSLLKLEVPLVPLLRCDITWLDWPVEKSSCRSIAGYCFLTLNFSFSLSLSFYFIPNLSFSYIIVRCKMSGEEATSQRRPLPHGPSFLVHLVALEAMSF